MKEIGRDIKVGNSLINLIIEIYHIRFRCTLFSSSFRKGLRQYHEIMQRIQCCIYALIDIARIVRDEYCLFGLWLCCSRWWNPVYTEVADGACCKREEGINKVHSLLNNSKSSMTHHNKASFSKVANPRKTPAWILNYVGIQEALPSRSTSLPRGQKYRNQKGGAKLQDWKEYSVRRQNSTWQQEDLQALCQQHPCNQ